MLQFAQKLLQWHNKNPRPLPWADGTRNPYKIWLSEVIMQQTRIEQGTPYYLRFIKRFPTIHHLAKASLDDVLKLWEGLGYYTRARNLHKAARFVVENLNGQFPKTYDELLHLPGIGPYSAAAISSFAFKQPHVVVDGNVKRLISRYCGIEESIDDPRTHEKIHSIATEFMNGNAPDVFNQAIMNFGALVCKPKPVCDSCPLSLKCYAHKNNLASALPLKTKKKENKHRYFHFIVLHYRGKILLQQRLNNDIWKGLYAPLLIEQYSSRSPARSKIVTTIKNTIGCDEFEFLKSTGRTKQILSHQTIHARYYHVNIVNPRKKLPEEFVWLGKKTIDAVGKPKLIAEMLRGLFQ